MTLVQYPKLMILHLTIKRNLLFKLSTKVNIKINNFYFKIFFYELGVVVIGESPEELDLKAEFRQVAMS